MKNNNSGTGLAVVIVFCLLLVIGWIGNAMEPKCVKSGCDNSRADGSSYLMMKAMTMNSNWQAWIDSIWK